MFGTALLTSADATALLGAITGAVTDNIAVVLTVVGGLAGIAFGRSMINRALKRGKI